MGICARSMGPLGWALSRTSWLSGRFIHVMDSWYRLVSKEPHASIMANLSLCPHSSRRTCMPNVLYRALCTTRPTVDAVQIPDLVFVSIILTRSVVKFLLSRISPASDIVCACLEQSA